MKPLKEQVQLAASLVGGQVVFHTTICPCLPPAIAGGVLSGTTVGAFMKAQEHKAVGFTYNTGKQLGLYQQTPTLDTMPFLKMHPNPTTLETSVQEEIQTYRNDIEHAHDLATYGGASLALVVSLAAYKLTRLWYKPSQPTCCTTEHQTKHI
ncbi:MAG: hypothetical protein ACMXYD_02995 [Candidatus Woesearchaeota archaeon]